MISGQSRPAPRNCAPSMREHLRRGPRGFPGQVRPARRFRICPGLFCIPGCDAKQVQVAAGKSSWSSLIHRVRWPEACIDGTALTGGAFEMKAHESTCLLAVLTHSPPGRYPRSRFRLRVSAVQEYAKLRTCAFGLRSYLCSSWWPSYWPAGGCTSLGLVRQKVSYQARFPNSFSSSSLLPRVRSRGFIFLRQGPRIE